MTASSEYWVWCICYGLHKMQNAIQGQTSFGSASVPVWNKDTGRHSQGHAAVVLWEGRCSIQASVGEVNPGVPIQKQG